MSDGADDSGPVPVECWSVAVHNDMLSFMSPKTALIATFCCLQLLAQSTSIHPLQQALNLFNSRKYQECFDIVAPWVTQNPQSATGHKLLGISEYMLGRPADALSEVRRATELAPTDPDAFYYLGRLYFSADNTVLALAAFQHAVQLDPTSARNYNQLGQTYDALARQNDAEQSYLRAIELTEKDSKKFEWPYYNLGVLYFSSGRVDQAIVQLQKALASNPQFPEAKVKLATILGTRNQIEEAIQLLHGALQTDPRNADAHYRLALLLTRSGKPDEAEREFALFRQYRTR